MRNLTARDGYSRWAAHYATETAVSALEERVVSAMHIATAGLALLDVGCGTARRLHAASARLAVGVDYTPEMLRQAAEGLPLAAADVRALPFASASFDVVWCRLVIGHVLELGRAYAELARVCRPSGYVIVTDFHPEAADAGHRRTFRDATGTVFEIRHFRHELADHATAAAVAGLELLEERAGEVGPEIREFYQSANRLNAYESQLGLRLVLALSYRRVA